MNEQQASELWYELTAQREIAIAAARATYQRAVADADDAFGQRLGERVVAAIVAERDATK